jgi:OPA family glycerol-3-phosphate transporter-like MFS transporter 1/2
LTYALIISVNRLVYGFFSSSSLDNAVITEIQGEHLSGAMAGSLSTIFDIGGTLGGILAGHLSDKLDARGIVAAAFIYGSLPSLLLYRVYGGVTLWLNMGLLFVAGFFVNGPYALITTAVSADLGSQGSLKGNGRAMATVTAIIDGTGSIGAAIGPLLTGYLSNNSGWNSVFAMLMLSAFTAGLLLTGVVLEEFKGYAAKVKLGKARRLQQIDLV